MIDDIIELVADVAADLLGEILPSRNTWRNAKPLTRFLWGLAGAAAAGLLCWGIVTVCIQ